MQKKYSSLKYFIGSAVFVAVLIAAACIGRSFLSGKEYYYPMALIIIIASCVPFFLSFEKKKPSARELVVIACMTALAVASRAAFYALPTVKPMCAIVIITAVALGAQNGFICGVLAMFASNFIFGQGPWTPFQMLGMGAVGLAAGLIFYEKKYSRNRWLLAAAGGALCFALYGLIVDISSVLMLVTDFSLKQIAAIYASGFGFNLSHGITTAVVLFVAGNAFTEKLERIKIKYGMF